MNAPISEFMGAALGTPETSQPAPSGHPDMDKPYAYEFGRTDHEGRFKVVIEHRYPTHAKSDWPIVPLFRRPAPPPGDVQVAAYALPDDIRVERAAQIDGDFLWAVRRNGDCLGRDGKWSYEPLPSSRTDAWLALHRFVTATAAIHAAIGAQQGEGRSV